MTIWWKIFRLKFLSYLDYNNMYVKTYLKLNVCFLAFFLQERSGNNSFTHNALSLKYKLDNEFELVFVVSVDFSFQCK